MRPTRRSVMLTLASMTAAGKESATEPLVGFRSQAILTLHSIFNGPIYRGRVEASQVAALLKTEETSLDDLILKLVLVARSVAHPPISNYFVGAVALGSSGDLYLGANIEVPGNMLGLATHAEQSAIANAYMSGERGIEAIAVRGTPCGHCRQFLSEVSIDITMRVLMGPGVEKKLSELLPNAFGPKNLGNTQGVFPPKKSQLTLAQRMPDSLSATALQAACGAYSPYSKSPSGVALETSTGRVFAGSYIENAAFNPSLPPLQAALAGYFAAGSNAGKITRAVLVEGSKTNISHELTSQSVLASLAPGAKFQRLTLSGI